MCFATFLYPFTYTADHLETGLNDMTRTGLKRPICLSTYTGFPSKSHAF